MTDGTELMVDMAGFQPATSRMQTERSSRLSYMPVCGGSWGDDGFYCVHRPGCLVLGCGGWCGAFAALTIFPDMRSRVKGHF